MMKENYNIQNDLFYKDPNSNKLVMTELTHIKRGYCCGSHCRHCPYEPKFIKGNININNKFKFLK